MKALSLFLVLQLMSFVAFSATESSVLSFQDWKSQKIKSAQIHYSSLESDYLTKKKATPQSPVLRGLYTELKDAKANISELSDLSVTDYFIGYLSQYKTNKAVFQSAIDKLAAQEVSEIMVAYADSLLKTSGSGISTAADSQPAEASK